jgi:hypothetical protein
MMRIFSVVSDEMRYGPAGFTRTPEVRALLAPYEKTTTADEEDPDWGGVIYFDGLPWREADQLLKLLPEQNGRDRQNISPSFEQFVRLGREFPEIRFHGYRVPAHRSDERITIEGYLYPQGRQAEGLYQRVCEIASEPDAYERATFAGEPMMSAWWD